jgi:hypothetical protein
MRSIEQKICNRVKEMRLFYEDKTVSLSKRDVVSHENGIVYVYLWGTRIAEVYDDAIILRSGGYRTPTTKSRLNALLRLANANLRIYQKNYTWYVWDSVLDETVEFHDGISFERFH